MSSLHHQGPPRDLARSNTSVLASQAEEPMLTLLASTRTRAVLHFTSRGTYVDLACIPDLTHKPRNQCWPCLPTSCPLHLTLNLDERLFYMATLPPSPTHVATSLVARISVVHQSPKPSNTCREQHMLGSIELQEALVSNPQAVNRKILTPKTSLHH